MTDPQGCECTGADAALAKPVIRRGPRLARLVDESHFGVSLQQCGRCERRFLTMFGERVDWIDGDDPQTWIAVLVSDAEAARILDTAPIDEDTLAQLLPGPRQMLYHDMPKGDGEVLAWRTGLLLVPAHD